MRAGSWPRGQRASGAGVLLLALGSVQGTENVPRLEPLTVAAAIETTRIMAPGDASTDPDRNGIIRSPDGKSWAALLVTGDLTRGGNWISVISDRLGAWNDSFQVKVNARLLTTSLGSAGEDSDASQLTFSHFNPLRWLDDRRVVFRFGDGARPIQVVSVDTQSDKVDYLTRHPTDVVVFDVSPGGALIYAAKTRHTMERSAGLMRDGFAVVNNDLASLLRGDVDGYSVMDRLWSTERYVKNGGSAQPIRLMLNAAGIDRFRPLVKTRFSPDGQLAVIDGSPDQVPDIWRKYTDKLFGLSVQEALRDRNGTYARFVRQLYLVDVNTGAARLLWDAPNAMSLQVDWSPDGRSVIVGPTFLPVHEADAAGLAGQARAQIDVHTGVWRKLPPVEPVKRSAVRGPRVSVAVRQDLNTPPTIVLRENRSGRERVIFDPNPGLRERFALGRVEAVTWPDKEGRTWSGLLYYPVRYSAGRRHPLVIQTHGHAETSSFSLNGTGPGAFTLGLGPGFSVYAAQPLANLDIAVLQMEDKTLPGIDVSPREPQVYGAAYEAAIEHLSSLGIVYRDKVGLVGFSRTGWHVEYALTHSGFPYAAAITSDNIDSSYFSSLAFWNVEFTQNNGGPPYADGLQQWMKAAPGFNADNVRTPIRLQLESAGLPMILGKWEMFSQLRLQGKPVELYVVPNINRGAHGLQNPAQCLASQQGAVDWFDFWLNGRERIADDASLQEQYRRWRLLR